MVLKALVIFLAVFAFATIGYNAFLAFLLSIVATLKKPKGLLVFGALTAVFSGIAWVAITIASDGHL